MHTFDLWSGRALPSPGEGKVVEGGGHGRASLEGGGLREGKARGGRARGGQPIKKSKKGL